MTRCCTIPAHRTPSDLRRPCRAWVGMACAGLLLLSAETLPGAAQQGRPVASPPPAHNTAPHNQAPAPRSGYLQPRVHSPVQSPIQSPVQPQRQPYPQQSHTPPPSQTSPARPSQPQRYDARPAAPTAAPPVQQRPLITAQPFAPVPGGSSPGISGPRNQYPVPPANLGRGNQQHLGGWLQSHSGQSFTSQEQSLRQEPGFSRLPQPQQQRLIDRLHQLDTMPPQRRERTLGRIENLERLSPDRRQQVRGSAQELSAMPEERRQQVRGAFRSLRDLPQQERQQQLASPAFRAQYNDHERQILGNLLSVEPYNPR